MRYSVWNISTRRYDYFESAEAPRTTHVGAPPTVLAAGALGATAEDAAWPLPAGARKVGSGDLPQGKVASSSASVAGLPVGWIALGVGLYVLFRRG